MNVEDVLTRFSALTGLGYEETNEWGFLVEDACSQIGARMREPGEAPESTSLLEAAAAALAYYEYKTIEASKRELSSFKAGDVSIELEKSGVQDAYKMYVSSLEACSGLLKDSNFIFGRVETLCTED